MPVRALPALLINRPKNAWWYQTSCSTSKAPSVWQMYEWGQIAHPDQERIWLNAAYNTIVSEKAPPRRRFFNGTTSACSRNLNFRWATYPSRVWNLVTRRDDQFSALLVLSSEALMQCNSEHTKCGSNIILSYLKNRPRAVIFIDCRRGFVAGR